MLQWTTSRQETERGNIRFGFATSRGVAPYKHGLTLVGRRARVELGALRVCKAYGFLYPRYVFHMLSGGQRIRNRGLTRNRPDVATRRSGIQPKQTSETSDSKFE